MIQVATDVVVIGAGPVGIFAAFQAGMFGMKTCCIDILSNIGGQCIELYPEKFIYDIPGYPKILAKDLIANLIKQASIFNPEYHLSQEVETISQCVYDDANIFQVKTKQGLALSAKIIIIASGNGAIVPNKPNIQGLRQYENSGAIAYKVSEYKQFHNKKVVIIGGGDSAFDWANIICDIAQQTYLVHRRDSFKCMQHNLETAKKNEQNNKLSFMIPYRLERVEGDGHLLKKVILTNVGNGTQHAVDADYLLMMLGQKTSLVNFNKAIELEQGHIKVDASTMQSNLDGIYAVGSASMYPNKLKLILNGFSEVSMALQHAYPKVFEGKKLNFQYSSNRNDLN